MDQTLVIEQLLVLLERQRQHINYLESAHITALGALGGVPVRDGVVGRLEGMAIVDAQRDIGIERGEHPVTITDITG